MSRVYQFLKSWFALIGFLFTLIFFVLIVKIYQNINVQKEIAVPELPSEPLLLELKLSGTIDEGVESKSRWIAAIDRLFNGREQINLIEIRNKIQLAAEDSQVKGLFLKLDALHGSLDSYSQIRKYLSEFKAKAENKKIYAWLAAGDTREYYLASVADVLYLPESGQLALPGPVMQRVYFGDALRKIGVDVQVLKEGAYKSAFEPFVNNQPSKASKEVMRSLIDSIFQSYQKDLLTHRNTSKEIGLKDIFAKSFYNADEALNLGLIDQMAYYEDAQKIVTDLLKSEGIEKLEIFDFYDYSSSKSKEQLSQFLKQENDTADGLAIIDAIGEIVMFGGDDREVITPRALIEKLDWAREEEKVKAVVLRISSPGGSALASDLIWRQVNLLAEAKPLVVSMGAVAASGGYYIASPAKKIFAGDFTLTGSIGVISMVPKFGPFEAKYGISFYTDSGSDYNNLFDPGKRLNPKDRRMLLDMSENTYNMFLTKVSQGRNIPVPDVKKIAEGRVWTGMQAKEIGLVDEIGGVFDAIQAAKNLAGFDTEKKYPLYFWHPKSLSLMACLRNISQCIEMSDMSLQAEIKDYLWKSYVGSDLKSFDATKYLKQIKQGRKDPQQMIWLGMGL